MSKENEEKEKPQKQLGEEKSLTSESLADKLAELLKKKLDETNSRLNAIETRLGRIKADLNTDHSEVKAALETSNTLLDSIMKFLDQKFTTTAQVQPASDMLQKIQMLFPKDLEEMLSFEESGEYVVVKPRQFLGSENFAKIASVACEAGGEYVSAGKESHFRIRK